MLKHHKPIRLLYPLAFNLFDFGSTFKFQPVFKSLSLSPYRLFTISCPHACSFSDSEGCVECLSSLAVLFTEYPCRISGWTATFSNQDHRLRPAKMRIFLYFYGVLRFESINYHPPVPPCGWDQIFSVELLGYSDAKIKSLLSLALLGSGSGVMGVATDSPWSRSKL